MSDTVTGKTQVFDWHSEDVKRRLRRRYAADRWLQILGIGAITLAVLLLGILVFSLIMSGYKAFYQIKVSIPIHLDKSKLNLKDPAKGNHRAIVRDALFAYFPDVKSRREKRLLFKVLSSGSQFIVRQYVIDNPSAIGSVVKLDLPLSDPYDQLYKNVIPRYIEVLSNKQKRWFESLRNREKIFTEGGVTLVEIDAYIDPKKVQASSIDDGDFKAILNEGFRTYFIQEKDTGYEGILAVDAHEALHKAIQASPDSIGKNIQIRVPVSDHYATLNKGKTPKIINPRFSTKKQFQWLDRLFEKGLIITPFNWELFTNSDSRFPELAGLRGAIVGSFYTLLVCFLISFPVGISAAVYLEEFAPKNRVTDLIEVNINNLASVPSVVFGLLGLAVFLNVFGLPRSAPLVGGMVLSLMTLPTIIIATRAALKAVPPSIREAALGIGASKHQVIMHHVLPLAMPGILTGTIIGLAQALGETAPLLLIGMNAFITSAPGDILEPATALPTQIFSWADSPERGFVSRTSAAILVLLGFLVIMNAIAIFLRQKFERKW